MSSHSSWLGLLASPCQLATLFLGIATCLLTLTTIPPSSSIYLARADYSPDNGSPVAWTAWFGNLGYCTADAYNDGLNHRHPKVHCSGMLMGYNVKDTLEQTGATIASIPEAPALSSLLTTGALVLNPIAIVLCLLSMAAFQAILRRPKGITYACAMASSITALLASGVAFILQHAFPSFVADGHRTAPDAAALTVTRGPLVRAIMLALVLQLAACVLGFYTCIGGKYQCEGGIRLEDVEKKSDSGVRSDRSISNGSESLDEKSLL
ncbi:hypothetical protein F4802DRAFT_601411 [Xylaria palmicola]|nr:hypothetical protein F4802DRAFT_601411 [Xylaria palmicola]